MRAHIVILLTLCTILSAPLAKADAFSQAGEAYARGDYEEAQVLYDSLLLLSPSPELYYNLGNVWFRQNELAKAILNYERALRLRPMYEDARYNLQFAQSRITDNIEDHNTFFISQWIIALRNLLPEGSWALLSIIFFLLTLTGAFLFAFARSVAIRKTGFHCAWIALLFSIFSFCFAGSLHHRDTIRNEAIIMQGVVNAKASPDRSGTDLFTLHEGTKVTILSTLSDWVEISVGDNRGWVKLNTLERI